MLTELLGDDQRFGDVAQGIGTSLVLAWHGDPPRRALDTVAQQFPDVPVQVTQLDVNPGELREAAQALLGSKAHLGVGGVYVSHDLSEIVVMVDDQVPDEAALAAALTSEVGFPVDVRRGAPVPAG